MQGQPGGIQLGGAVGAMPAGNGAANGGSPGAEGEAPVSFFAPAGGGSGPIVLGPDGQPLRKRRRRRRRGRGGRQREWRGQGPGGDGGDGGAPSSGDGGAASDGGSSGDGDGTP